MAGRTRLLHDRTQRRRVLMARRREVIPRPAIQLLHGRTLRQPSAATPRRGATVVAAGVLVLPADRAAAALPQGAVVDPLEAAVNT